MLMHFFLEKSLNKDIPILPSYPVPFIEITSIAFRTIQPGSLKPLPLRPLGNLYKVR